MPRSSRSLRRPLGTLLALAVGTVLSVSAAPAPSIATTASAAAPAATTTAMETARGCCLPGIHRSFDLKTGEIVFGGYGTADGLVAFENRRRAVASAKVTDWCDHNPGDGLGAGLWVDIAFGDGTGRVEYLFGDFNGCTNSSASGTQMHSVPNPNDKRIVAVQMVLCYGDPDNWGSCQKIKRSRIIANPHS